MSNSSDPLDKYGYPDESQTRSPYTFRQQLRRMAWWFGSLFFTYSLSPMYGWRRFVLRLFGAELGDHVFIRRSARIEFPWNLKMARYSTIGEQAWIYSLGKVTIGEFATISQRVFLCTGSHDYTKPQMPLITRPIVVGDGAWIAADAYVGPGVVVGNHAVVAARSVVVKDLPPGMVCAGHPCKPIKPRLPPEART